MLGVFFQLSIRWQTERIKKLAKQDKQRDDLYLLLIRKILGTKTINLHLFSRFEAQICCFQTNLRVFFFSRPITVP